MTRSSESDWKYQGIAMLLMAIPAVLLFYRCSREDGDGNAVHAQRDVPVAIDENVYVPYTAELYPRTFAEWGEAGLRRIDALRKAAAERAALSPECDRVEMAEHSESRSVPTSKLVVFVDCANGERFYVSESDVAMPSRPLLTQSQKGLEIGSGGAIERCLEMTRAQLRFPSSFDAHALSIRTAQGQTTGNWGVDFDFTAANGLGLEIRQSAHCIVDTSGRAEVTFVDR